MIRAYLRPAVIISVNRTRHTCLIRYIDRPTEDDNGVECTLPHPFSAPGWGVFAMPTVGTRVMVGYRSGERPIIVSTIPLNQYSEADFEDPLSVLNVSVNESEYPFLNSGEVALQSVAGSNMIFNNDGSINFNLNNSNIEYNLELETAIENFTNKYVNTEAERSVSGIVRRDIRDNPKSIEANEDKLKDLNYEFSLADIGRNPNYEARQKTINIETGDSFFQISIIRNPSLVENRKVVYEFAREDNVLDFDTEVRTMSGETEDEGGNKIFLNNNRRDLQRTDILNLGLHLPNNLIEHTEGTVVDIYGNILDLNRNKIDFSNIEKRSESGQTDAQKVELESTLLRRSIKYHFELNARKEGFSEAVTPFDQTGEATPLLDGLDDDQATTNGYSHSRLSLDIDGEGQVKVNIPSSSNKGNIPLHSRYITSFDPNNRNSSQYRNENKKDIRHLNYGLGGIDLSDDTYIPENILDEGDVFKYATPYHDLSTLAAEVVEEAPINTTISNKIDDQAANAGGRSLNLNADGSVELSIGRDVADKKSMLIDTAGSIMSMIGKDKQNNSIVSQLDGNVRIQVGDTAVPGETALDENKVEIAIKTPLGFHKIQIDGSSMKFSSPGNIVFEASGSIAMVASGEALLSGSTVYMYGGVDETGALTSRKRTVLPNGQEIK